MLYVHTHYQYAICTYTLPYAICTYTLPACRMQIHTTSMLYIHTHCQYVVCRYCHYGSHLMYRQYASMCYMLHTGSMKCIKTNYAHLYTLRYIQVVCLYVLYTIYRQYEVYQNQLCPPSMPLCTLCYIQVVCLYVLYAIYQIYSVVVCLYLLHASIYSCYILELCLYLPLLYYVSIYFCYILELCVYLPLLYYMSIYFCYILELWNYVSIYPCYIFQLCVYVLCHTLELCLYLLLPHTEIVPLSSTYWQQPFKQRSFLNFVKGIYIYIYIYMYRHMMCPLCSARTGQHVLYSYDPAGPLLFPLAYICMYALICVQMVPSYAFCIYTNHHLRVYKPQLCSLSHVKHAYVCTL